MTLEQHAQAARRIRLTDTRVYVDACFETKADPPCPVCQAVERGIAAALETQGAGQRLEPELVVRTEHPQGGRGAIVVRTSEELVEAIRRVMRGDFGAVTICAIEFQGDNQ